MSTFFEKGYGWPLFVIVLLVSSVVMMGLVVMAARSDGGAQVVDNYYEQAVQWDSLASARNQAAVLGWTAELAVSRGTGGIEGSISLSDSAGLVLTDQIAVVSLSRPQLAETVATTEALESGVPGTYAFSSAANGAGLWDIEVIFTSPSQPDRLVHFDWRRELR